MQKTLDFIYIAEKVNSDSACPSSILPFRIERQNLHTATFHDMRSYIASIGHMMNLGSDHDIKTKRQNMEMSSRKHKSTGAAKS